MLDTTDLIRNQQTNQSLCCRYLQQGLCEPLVSSVNSGVVWPHCGHYWPFGSSVQFLSPEILWAICEDFRGYVSLHVLQWLFLQNKREESSSTNSVSKTSLFSDSTEGMRGCVPGSHLAPYHFVSRYSSIWKIQVLQRVSWLTTGVNSLTQAESNSYISERLFIHFCST